MPKDKPDAERPVVKRTTGTNSSADEKRQSRSEPDKKRILTEAGKNKLRLKAENLRQQRFQPDSQLLGEQITYLLNENEMLLKIKAQQTAALEDASEYKRLFSAAYADLHRVTDAIDAECESYRGVFERVALNIQRILGYARIGKSYDTDLLRLQETLTETALPPVFMALLGGESAGSTGEPLNWVNTQEAEECVSRLIKILSDYPRRARFMNAVLNVKQAVSSGGTAAQIKTALEKAGVFPLFYDDAGGDSAVTSRFLTGTQEALEYPGLFLRSGSGYEQLSGFPGQRRSALQ